MPCPAHEGAVVPETLQLGSQIELELHSATTAASTSSAAFPASDASTLAAAQLAPLFLPYEGTTPSSLVGEPLANTRGCVCGERPEAFASNYVNSKFHAACIACTAASAAGTDCTYTVRYAVPVHTGILCTCASTCTIHRAVVVHSKCIFRMGNSYEQHIRYV